MSDNRMDEAMTSPASPVSGRFTYTLDPAAPLTVADLPAGTVFARFCVGGVWEERGTDAGVCLWVQLSATDPPPQAGAPYALDRDLFYDTV